MPPVSLNGWQARVMLRRLLTASSACRGRPAAASAVPAAGRLGDAPVDGQVPQEEADEKSSFIAHNTSA